jgi:hypothetical protein
MKMTANFLLVLAVFLDGFAFQDSFVFLGNSVFLDSFASLDNSVFPDSFAFLDNIVSPDNAFLLTPVFQDIDDDSKSFKKKPSGFFSLHIYYRRIKVFVPKAAEDQCVI